MKSKIFSLVMCAGVLTGSFSVMATESDSSRNTESDSSREEIVDFTEISRTQCFQSAIVRCLTMLPNPDSMTTRDMKYVHDVVDLFYNHLVVEGASARYSMKDLLQYRGSGMLNFDGTVLGHFKDTIEGIINIRHEQPVQLTIMKEKLRSLQDDIPVFLGEESFAFEGLTERLRSEINTIAIGLNVFYRNLQKFEDLNECRKEQAFEYFAGLCNYGYFEAIDALSAHLTGNTILDSRLTACTGLMNLIDNCADIISSEQKEEICRKVNLVLSLDLEIIRKFFKKPQSVRYFFHCARLPINQRIKLGRDLFVVNEVATPIPLDYLAFNEDRAYFLKSLLISIYQEGNRGTSEGARNLLSKFKLFIENDKNFGVPINDYERIKAALDDSNGNNVESVVTNIFRIMGYGDIHQAPNEAEVLQGMDERTLERAIDANKLYLTVQRGIDRLNEISRGEEEDLVLSRETVSLLYDDLCKYDESLDRLENVKNNLLRAAVRNNDAQSQGATRSACEEVALGMKEVRDELEYIRDSVTPYRIR